MKVSPITNECLWSLLVEKVLVVVITAVVVTLS